MVLKCFSLKNLSMLQIIITFLHHLQTMMMPGTIHPPNYLTGNHCLDFCVYHSHVIFSPLPKHLSNKKILYM